MRLRVKGFLRKHLLTYSAARSLDIVDGRIGIVYRLVQVAVALACVVSNVSDGAFDVVGKGQYFFSLGRTALPVYKPDAVSETAAWTADRLFQVERDSLFVPMSYVDQLEAEGTCHNPGDSWHCASDLDCQSRSNDPGATCRPFEDPFGSNSERMASHIVECPTCRCFMRQWCPLHEQLADPVLLLQEAERISFQVTARFAVSEDTQEWASMENQLFSNYRKGEPEICNNCRFTVNEILREVLGQTPIQRDRAQQGLEVQLTYTWHCPHERGLDRYGCDIHTSMTALSSSSGFEYPVVSQPWPHPEHGQVRRRTIFRGMMVRLQGDGGIHGFNFVALLNLGAQILSYLFVANVVAELLAFNLLHGATRRENCAVEEHVEQHHHIIDNIVMALKEDNEALQCMPDRMLQQLILSASDALCPCTEEVDGRNDKILSILSLLNVNRGNIERVADEVDIKHAKARLRVLRDLGFDAWVPPV